MRKAQHFTVRTVSIWLGVACTAVMGVSSVCAQAFPPQYANALQRTQYAVFTGDVNGDGFRDVLAKAKQSIILIDYDVLIPVVRRPVSPTFALLSQNGAPYILDANPSAAVINSPVWQPNAYDLVFGDVLGTGSVSMLLRARMPGVPSFLVTTSSSNGTPMLLEELTTARIGYDLSAAGTTVALSDTNRDSRADLIIRVNGLIEGVLTADAQGMFAKPANDSDSVILAWRSFCAALNSGDVNSAARFLSADAQAKYVPALQRLGSALTGVTASWSEPKAVRISALFATYGVQQTVSGANEIHLVLFMKEDGRWVLSDF
jgi:hypothetical protein